MTEGNAEYKNPKGKRTGAIVGAPVGEQPPPLPEALDGPALGFQEDEAALRPIREGTLQAEFAMNEAAAAQLIIDSITGPLEPESIGAEVLAARALENSQLVTLQVSELGHFRVRDVCETAIVIGIDHQMQKLTLHRIPPTGPATKMQGVWLDESDAPRTYSFHRTYACPDRQPSARHADLLDTVGGNEP